MGRVVSGSIDHSVWVWNAVTGEIECVLNGHSDRVWSVAFSHDGTRVVSGANDRTLRIWNVPTRTTKRTLEGLRTAATGKAKLVLIGHSDSVKSVAFSPDGTRVVSGSSDKTVRIWNVNTGEMERQTPTQSQRCALDVA